MPDTYHLTVTTGPQERRKLCLSAIIVEGAPMRLNEGRRTQDNRKHDQQPMSRSSPSSCSSVLSLDGEAIGYRLGCWNCKTVKTRKTRFSAKERRAFATMHSECKWREFTDNEWQRWKTNADLCQPETKDENDAND